MSNIERITHLNAPPVIGRSYLVPTVLYPWLRGQLGPWPVFPFKHEDGRFFQFKELHYHVDPRFLNAENWSRAGSWNNPYGLTNDEAAFSTCQIAPLGRANFQHPTVIWRRRRCARNSVPFQHSSQKMIQALAAHYEGQSCRAVRTGWVCPHQRFPLGSIAAVDGVITCPLHGLRIDADTGVVLT